MSGLGDALQMVGGSMMEMGKEQRLEKLRQEQEARAEERDKRKEDRAYQRQLRQAQGEPRIVDRGGKRVMQYRNAEGNIIREEEVDAYTLEQLNREDQKEKVSLDKIVQEVELGGKKLRDYDSDRALDTQYRQAQISERLAARDENIAQAGAANRRGLEKSLTGDDEPTQEEVIKLVADENKDIKEELELTEVEYMRYAEEAVKEAAKRGVHPNTVMRNALRLRSERKDRMRTYDKNKND